MSTLVELCAGTASLSLWALARCPPLCGFMGSKRRWAPALVPALGVDRPERVVLCDAGPWGDVWSVLLERSRRLGVAALLEEWADETPADLWTRLVETPPAPNAPVFRVAQYLWLQGRAAGTIPIWWSAGHGRWRSPTGAGDVDATLRTKGIAPSFAGRYSWGSGRRTAALIAQRIRQIDVLDWSRVDVHHGDCRTLEPIPGSTVLLDPPYLGCPRYAAELPRADVLALAQRWVAAGARVAVCEAVPLVAELGAGWHARRLSGRKSEWVTASWPIAIPEQLDLWRAA